MTMKAKIILSKNKIVIKAKDKYGNTRSLTFQKSENLSLDAFQGEQQPALPRKER